MFNIQFSDYFKRDLQYTQEYIIDHFKNPQAAADLLDEMDEKIERLIERPYIYSVYNPLKELKNEYRNFSVGNYLIFYRIEDYHEGEKDIRNVVIEAMFNEKQNVLSTMKRRI